MVTFPIVVNGDYTQIVGSVVMSFAMEEIYNRSNHLVINPILRTQEDGSETIVCFSIYSAPEDPEPLKKRRKKRAKVEGDLA